MIPECAPERYELAASQSFMLNAFGYYGGNRRMLSAAGHSGQQEAF